MGTFADEQVLYNNNPSPTTAVGLAQMRYNQTAIRELPGASAPVIVEITDGAIAPASAFVRVDTEGQAAADELEVISPVLSDTDSLHDGMILYLQAADQDRVVTVRPTVSANGIQTFDGQDVVLDTTTWLVLQLRQGTWYEMRDLFSKALGSAIERASGSLVPVGSIIWSANATVPAGYLLCNGASVGRDTYPELFAAIGTTYGDGDGSTTFNLPNLIGRFLEGSSTSGIVKAAGLPNITGRAVGWQGCVGGGGYEGALSGSGTVQSGSKAGGSVLTYDFDVRFDASSSSPIYGNSTTVQPPSVTALPCIKAFSSVVGDATVIAGQLVNEIQSKVSLDGSNVSSIGSVLREYMTHAAMPSGQYEDISYSGGGSYVYTAPADGYVGITGQVSQPDLWRGVMLTYRPSISSSDYVGIYSTGAFPTCFLPVARGRTVNIDVNTGVTVSYCRFYYANGSVTA